MCREIFQMMIGSTVLDKDGLPQVRSATYWAFHHVLEIRNLLEGNLVSRRFCWVMNSNVVVHAVHAVGMVITVAAEEAVNSVIAHVL